jgi:hypothetical protein
LVARAAKPDCLGEAAGREGGPVETDLITTIVVRIDFGQRHQSVVVSAVWSDTPPTVFPNLVLSHLF